MWEIEIRTCINFTEGKSPDNYYINVTNKYVGCFSWIGCANSTDGQWLNLAPGCMDKGRMMHEFIHALGFVHQHSIPSRNEYVEILEKNISPGALSEFTRYSEDLVNDKGFEYDYASIMSYGPNDYGVDGKPTIRALNSSAPGADKMGQREYLTDTDIAKINKFYECPPKVYNFK